MPQFRQNFASVPAATVPLPPLHPLRCPRSCPSRIASIMAWPMAIPAPRPAPTPAAPPPSFARRNGNRLRHLVLRVAAHVADHVHADALIENLLQFVGKRQILDHEAIEREAKIGECRLQLPRRSFSESATWFAAMSRNGTWLPANVSVILPTMVLRS